MKVTLINKDDSGGGAAMACMRLFKALKLHDVDVRMLVQEHNSSEPGVSSTIKGRYDRIQANFNFLFERITFILKERDKSVRFAFSPANTGIDISRDPLIQDADLLHLHWPNGGFLSLNNIDRLFSLNKPVVWTLHDMWPFTGGCHYSGPSEKFTDQCGNCHFMKYPHARDLSSSGWHNKHEIYQKHKNITFIACSNWMREMAMKSSLLQGFDIVTLPNAIDTEVFQRKSKSASRKKWGVEQHSKVILFGAANINHTRKGVKYLVDALHHLKGTGELSDQAVQVVTFGKSHGFDFTRIPFPVINLPVIRSETDLAEIFSLADVFVLPSLEDNLPNMAMEALSCSTPVVAFRSGGIQDMVDHEQNGYLAELMSVVELAKGILWVLNRVNPHTETNAREKVVRNFSYEVIAEKHLELYKTLLKIND